MLSWIQLNDPTPEERLAAGRRTRINARAERLRDAGRGFFSSLVGGIFGGLIRGR
jgi:hypothetical protein